MTPLNTRNRIKAAELVPIADRLRYMQAFRVGAIFVVALVSLAAPRSLVASVTELAAATAAYAIAAVGAEVLARTAEGKGAAIFGATLIVDGIYLAYASYATGGPASLVRYLILVHLITVSLLASYRTGLKLALWHSLLLIVAFYAERSGLLHRVPVGLGIGTPFQRLIEFSVLFWLVAIATASYSAVNERELRRRRYDLEALAAMAARLEEVSEPDDVADTVIDAVSDAFDFPRAVLVGCSDEEAPRVLSARGAAPAEQHSDAPLAQASVIAVASRQRGTQLVTTLNPAVDAWLAALLPDARNLVVVPLSAEHNSFGALVAEHGRRVGARIERRVVAMVERFVSHGSLALRNAWLLEQIQQLAATDGLTGLANRTSFDEALMKELARAARHADDVGLLMLDIDHFKLLNDQHGHLVGDEVLRRVADELARACRRMDTVARYGGEEFAIVLPTSGPQQTFEVGERVRHSIAAALSDHGVTVSVGTANFPFDGATPEDLVEAADDALYESKRGGRNRVTSSRQHDEELMPPPADLRSP